MCQHAGLGVKTCKRRENFEGKLTHSVYDWLSWRPPDIQVEMSRRELDSHGVRAQETEPARDKDTSGVCRAEEQGSRLHPGPSYLSDGQRLKSVSRD